jgi:phage terminase large subunit
MAIIAITRVTDVGRRPANRSCGADGPRGASRRRDVAIGEVRRLIQRYRQPFINEATTEAGRDALGYYHERRDENRNVGLGPEHDWSSHAADAGGYLAISYEEPPVKSTGFGRPPPPRAGSHWAA